ncbi:MAG: Gfo/Idh/MocA family oxidoreductase [Nitrososphaerota archaeon]|nr:Gfo/Idh/MocA family oxidoreductase [Candidatus Calditenuaceae archaeon]MDW8073191.1 Gfo/Idh/MocA family oxidoreductase [Nitrososphaerota archaeon]
MAQVSVVLIGCGGIMNVHARCLSPLRDLARVVGCVDVVKERAEDFADRFGCSVYTDPVKAVAELRPEAAIIAVPPNAHGFEEELLDYGVHLFIEKPIAIDLDLASRILRKIEKTGVVNSVGYMWRYLDVVQLAKKELPSPDSIGMIYGQYVWAANFPPGHWWLKKSLSGGQIIEQATHTIDLIRYFAGEAVSVFARLERRLSKDGTSDVEDSSVITIRHKSGVASTVVATWRSANTLQETFVRIFARDLVVDIVGHQRRAVFYRNNRVEDVRSVVDPYLEELRVFFEAVKSGDTSGILSPYSDAYKTLELTIRANESHNSGRIIEV